MKFFFAIIILISVSCSRQTIDATVEEKRELSTPTQSQEQKWFFEYRTPNQDSFSGYILTVKPSNQFEFLKYRTSHNPKGELVYAYYEKSVGTFETVNGQVQIAFSYETCPKHGGAFYNLEDLGQIMKVQTSEGWYEFTKNSDVNYFKALEQFEAVGCSTLAKLDKKNRAPASAVKKPKASQTKATK